MSLRNKITTVILLSLILQVFVSGTFTIRTFLNESKENSISDLESSWARSRFYIEKLKHEMLTDIFNLKNFIQQNLRDNSNADELIKSIMFLINGLEVDQLVMADSSGNVIMSYPSNPNGLIIPVKAAFTLLYPGSYFLTQKEGDSFMLYLVTGSWIYTKEKKPFILTYLVKRIDNDMVNKMAMELGTDIAFFVGNNFITANIPPFQLQNSLTKNKEMITRTSTGKYWFISKILSPVQSTNIYLVVLQSTLYESLYTQKLIKSFLFAFFITFIISIVIATFMTSYFTSPFLKLRNWIESYTSTGELKHFRIRTKDEIGYLTNSFYLMAQKLIREEQVIRKQLDEISFFHSYNDNILKNLKAGILVINSDNKIEYGNDFIFNNIERERERVIGSNIKDFINNNFTVREKEYDIKDEIRNFTLDLNNGEEKTFSVKSIPMRISASNKKYLLVFEDITQIEQSWKKMTQAEKIASLGLLSAGMAHEINNPLGTILSHVQFLLAVEKDEDKLDSLNWIEREARRIDAIVNRLLHLARKEDLSEQSNINEVIIGASKFFSQSLTTKNINLKLDLQSELPDLQISSANLEQVIFNIIINAMQAIDSNGNIYISTRKMNNRVICKIQDNGIGMSKEQLKHIFDPFFSTKTNGSGTGLGLSICYSIVNRTGGEIHVTSKEGEGTSVELHFPYVAGQEI